MENFVKFLRLTLHNIETDLRQVHIEYVMPIEGVTMNMYHSFVENALCPSSLKYSDKIKIEFIMIFCEFTKFISIDGSLPEVMLTAFCAMNTARRFVNWQRSIRCVATHHLDVRQLRRQRKLSSTVVVSRVPAILRTVLGIVVIPPNQRIYIVKHRLSSASELFSRTHVRSR